MQELRDLYQEVILDHSKKPRNYRKLEGATHRAQGYNPLCGDRFTVFLRLEDEIIQEASFQGNGCAISTASASMMTASLKGKTRQEAETMFGAFHELVTGQKAPVDSADPVELGKLGVFAGVHEFPVRVKCATLAWHTLHAALENKEEAVSTE